MTATLDRPPAAPDPPPHPRFRARWARLRRDEGRRRLHRLIALATVAVAVLVALASTRTPLLDVDAITVEGSLHTPPAFVAGASGVTKGQPMVEVKSASTARRLEALPWVAEVRVARRWPATVAIAVRERTPVAQVGRATSGWFLIDGEGRLLTAVDTPAPDLVRLAGSIAGEAGDDLGPRLAGARTVAAAIGPALAPRIEQVREVGDDLHLALVGGGEVLFGPAEQVDDKLTTLADLLAADTRPCPRWDVRVPSAPALTPNAGCA